MSAKKKNGNGNTSIGSLELKSVVPKTIAQKKAFDSWYEGRNLLLFGQAGTGKTFLAMYFALEALHNGNCSKIVIVRSALPSRNIGFLPGDEEEKMRAYEQPYEQICTELFNKREAYNILKGFHVIDFTSTSFFRGITFRDAIIIFDEFQNTHLSEFSTVMTRMGKDTRVIVCGDTMQSDVDGRQKDDAGIAIDIMREMKSVSSIEFLINDIIRGGFVKEFLLAKNQIAP